MGIKHKVVKAPNEMGLSSEWNDDHKIDSDVNFATHSGINVGEPINPSDIATKNYADSMAGGVADELGGTWQQQNFFINLTGNTTTTILNYSGSGWLFFIRTFRSYARDHQMIITIDGAVYLIIPSVRQEVYNSNLNGAIYSGLKKFNSSLKVEVKDLGGSTDKLTATVCYSKL